MSDNQKKVNTGCGGILVVVFVLVILPVIVGAIGWIIVFIGKYILPWGITFFYELTPESRFRRISLMVSACLCLIMFFLSLMTVIETTGFIDKLIASLQAFGRTALGTTGCFLLCYFGLVICAWILRWIIGS